MATSFPVPTSGTVGHLHEIARRFQALEYVHLPEDLEAAVSELSNIAEELQQSEAALRWKEQQLEEALEEAQAQRLRYQELFYFAPDGYVVTDTDALIQEANHAAMGLLRTSKRFLKDKPLPFFVAADWRPDFYARLGKLRRGRSVGHWETCLQSPNCEPTFVDLSVTPIVAEGDQLAGYRWILRDITRLKQAQQQAMQTERLATIGQTVAALAHESRNALQRSQAYLAILGIRLQGQQDNLDILNRIQHAQNDLQQLFEDLRIFAAPLKLDRHDCDLAEVWREAWDDLGSLRNGREASLREDIGAVDVHCQASAFHLKQVFRNILENALGATSGAAVIVIQCADATIDTHPALRIAVRDNGPGFPAERRDKVFEPFFTTKERGTGLGLPICKRIVEAHVGRIEIGQHEGPGAEIVITLPRKMA
jgi:PAS domain S-box-containing protein